MTDLKELQKIVYQNKVDHGFNTTDMPLEFCCLVTEVAEAFKAQHDIEAFGEELADIAIYLLGIAEIKGIDLEQEILKKVEKNRRRKYIQQEDGSWTKIENALD